MRTEVYVDELLHGLDEAQRAAVTSPARTLCVLAGAGSGKTRVLTRRVAYRFAEQTADPAHALVVTFTRKAANELRQRLAHFSMGQEVATGTFHALAYAQLRRRWLDQGRLVPAIATQPLRLVEGALQTTRLARSLNARAVSAEISWAKSRNLAPQQYEEAVRNQRRRALLPGAQFVRLYEAYEAEKRKRKVLDYDDLLLLLTDIINSDRAFAEAQRWRFRHLFVDEFQDLNPAQFALLQAWLGDRDDLFVVGDPNQAIYGWNGADSTVLRDAERHFPGIEIFRLDTNYRSTAQILAAARAILPDTAPVASLTHELSEVGTPPQFWCSSDERAEAIGIARQVRLAHGRSWMWSDIAVLVRTNAQRGVIERALQETGVPCRSVGGASWMSHEDVRVALDFLRETPQSKLAQHVADIEQLVQDASTEQAQGYLQELAAAARQCLADDPQMSIADFLSWVDIASKFDGPTGADLVGSAVTVTTFHRAKGLEWPVVFLAGVEEGLVPHGNSSGEELAEERRLFYVAITRARVELHCSWAEKREIRGSIETRRPSPWLALMQRALSEVPDPMAPVAVSRSELEQTRAALHATEHSSSGNGVRDALERWRVARAKLTGIDKRLILSNEILDAIVELKPSTIEELATIEGFGPVRAASIGPELLDLIAG